MILTALLSSPLWQNLKLIGWMTEPFFTLLSCILLGYVIRVCQVEWRRR
jgi:hypothetical protein